MQSDNGKVIFLSAHGVCTVPMVYVETVQIALFIVMLLLDCFY